MELLFQNYQASYFTNNSDVTATPPVLSMLLSNLAALSLLPMFGQELNALTGEKRQIVIMTSPDQNFRVEFPLGAIVFHGVGGSSEEFINKVKDIMKSLQSIFPNKKATRLSVINSYFYHDSQDNYSRLYRELFTHRNAEPFEWDNRIVERVNLKNLNESVNSGSTVRRCFIQTPLVNNNHPTEVINFEVDTNTLAENNSLRFDFNSANSIVSELQENNANLIEQLSRYTNK
ncbi:MULTISPECIES: hypothetical protein [Escherichia]|uniref:Uncharacterized protein n=7 Tax=Escherichia coli TaxID=562 RepID=A0A8T6A6H6_ECOLX|nr:MULTISPECIES: hypothetical protein [Escherichia]EEC8207271.1 hypothetical protein [Escherichia coli]EES2369641.1 hypothetical protein [Escherichia coli]EEV6095375.1 hypothetical protein [Escherichia coli]EEY0835775.1 hypothetical protein [Escherichia coli]EEY5282547.1 hypothetical protein [Escherichia coli]